MNGFWLFLLIKEVKSEKMNLVVESGSRLFNITVKAWRQKYY